jgi:hypothetical protein
MISSVQLIQWIDVDHELPPRGIDVLIACADGVQQGVRRTDAFRSYLRGNNPVFDVTHWAYLPRHPLDEEPEVRPEPRQATGRRAPPC